MAKGLQITARPATGFRRAGVHHPPTPVVHAPDAFTDEQVKALKAEPNLIVVDVDAAPGGVAPQGGASGEASRDASPKGKGK